jgi:2-oxoglutarate ferredoxin oxidoreductase subunit gamma
VSIESLRKAVEEIVSERYVKMNIEAIEYGYESVTKEYRIRSEQKVRTLGFE